MLKAYVGRIYNALERGTKAVHGYEAPAAAWLWLSSLTRREEWMKHCFQPGNGECTASFTALHLKWRQLVYCDSAACFYQSNSGVRSPKLSGIAVLSNLCVYSLWCPARLDDLLSIFDRCSLTTGCLFTVYFSTVVLIKVLDTSLWVRDLVYCQVLEIRGGLFSENINGSHKASSPTLYTRTLIWSGCLLFSSTHHMQNSCEEQPVYLTVLWGRQGGCGWLSPLLLHNRDFDKTQQEEGKILHGGTKIDCWVCVALGIQQVWLSYDRHRDYHDVWRGWTETLFLSGHDQLLQKENKMQLGMCIFNQKHATLQICW